MCGLIGEINFSKKSLNLEDFKANIDILKNRGPDSRGYFSFENIFQLGFRRLSIIDLDNRSNQPMTMDDKKLIITFNGEIYNFKKIKNQLIQENFEFQTNSDTEVILALYKLKGKEGLRLLRGMFSIVICDLRKKKFLFIRDPYGIKPLYYYRNNETFLFSSTLKSLLNFKQINKKISEESLNFFYFFGFIKENQTIIEGVKSFEPGYLYEVDFSNNFNKIKVFDVADIFRSTQKKEIDLKEHFENNLINHLQSDVPVAVLLSSGLDSSVILNTLNEKKINTHAITLGFEEFKGKIDDETIISDKFCKYLKINHKKIYLTNNEIIDRLDNFFINMDQPSYDGLNTYLVTQILKENNFKVAISGLGADELFGGYNTFSRMKFLNKIRFLYNNLIFKFLINILNKFFQGNKYFFFFKLLSEFNSPYQIYLLLRSKKDSLFKVNINNIKKILNEKNDYDEMEISNMTSLLESKIYMKNQLLKDTDWASMANSIEIRVPFVDYDFLESFKYSEFNIKNGKKSIFKRLFKIPKFILKKKKNWIQYSIQTNN